MKKRGQIAVEYILIITVALMIILPGIYLFRNYVSQSSDQIVERRLTEISNSIITKGRKMYYYGPPSKSTVTVELPPEIRAMYLLGVNGSDKEVIESYLVFRTISSQGEQDFLFESDVPLYAVDEASRCEISDQCSKGYCICFDNRFYSKGIKNFEVQAKDCIFGTCIFIDEISPDLR